MIIQPQDHFSRVTPMPGTLSTISVVQNGRRVNPPLFESRAAVRENGSRVNPPYSESWAAVHKNGNRMHPPFFESRAILHANGRRSNPPCFESWAAVHKNGNRLNPPCSESWAAVHMNGRMLDPPCSESWAFHKNGRKLNLSWFGSGLRHCLHRRTPRTTGDLRRRGIFTVHVCTASLEVNGPVRGGGFLELQGVSFRPPGTEITLLDNVSMSLPEKRLGLVYGPSGSGKTTLLQMIGGLATPSNGAIYLGKEESGPAALSARVGVVFQFPERYFLTDTIVEELLFGYSKQTQDLRFRQALSFRLQSAAQAVGLSVMPLDMNPRALSDGYKRRLALAVQLVRMPDVMLLDEPLAGLDWRAKADVVKLLSALKKQKTIIVVSHDLKELAGLVDKSWRMDMGGKLTEQ